MRVVVMLLALLLAVPAAPARAESPEEQLAAASALYDAGKYSEAAVRLDQFLAANPKHAKAAPAALALGRCQSALKQYAKAIPAYEKAAASKDASVVSAAQLGLGEAALQTHQWEKAASALGAAVKTTLPPDQSAVAWYWLAQADFQLERYPASEEAYLKVTRDLSRADFVDDAYFGAGLAALRQGKTTEARQRLRTVLDRYPKSEDRPQAAVALAQLDQDAKKYREARQGFEAALREPALKGGELRDTAEEGLIRVLLELQDYPAAASHIDATMTRLPATDPRRYRAELTLGHCRYRQKQYEPALAAYLDVAKSTEGAVAGEGHYWAANAALALNRPAEAAAQFSRVAERFPKHELAPKAQLKAGDALAAAHQTDAASAAYRKVVDRYPQSAEAAIARKALGELVDSVNDPAQLAAALKNAAPPERARGTLRMARLYLNGKKYAEAAGPLSELVKTRPEPEPEVAAEAQYLLGLALEGQGKAAPATAAYTEAVRRSASASWAADAQTRAAWLYLELKQPASAEKSAVAAVALKPAPAVERQARLALLQAQLDQQQWDPAVEGARALLATNPPADVVPTLLYTQAWAGEKRGKAEESLPLWERLASEFPRSEYAPEALLRLGDARFKAEKFDEARAKYAALLDGAPKSPLAPEARFKLGSALYRLNQTAAAATEWDRVATDPKAAEYQPEALYWAGLALEKSGKKPEAIDRLTRLTTQYPKHARVANAKIRLAALNAVK
jgi:TolA-binding protein